MSLNMIRGVPINQLYDHIVGDNVWMVTKHWTPTSRVHSGFRSKGGTHHYHYENILWHFQNFYYVVFSWWVNPISMWRLDVSLSMICEMWSLVYPHNSWWVNNESLISVFYIIFQSILFRFNMFLFPSRTILL